MWRSSGEAARPRRTAVRGRAHAAGRRRAAIAHAAASVLVCTACAGGNDVASGPERWHVGGPDLEIGPSEQDPDYAFHRVASVMRLDGGELLVAERGGHTVRVYDDAGRLLRSLGRRGGGPDEFGFIASVTRYAGDSVVVFDPMHPRLSIWSTEGPFARSLRLALDPVVRRVVGLGTGEFVAFRSAGSIVREDGGSSVDSADVVLLSPAGETVRTLARLPYQLQHGYAAPGGNVLSSTLPLFPDALVAAADSAVYYAWTDRTVVFRLTAAGIDSVVIVRPARPLSAAAIDAQLRAHLARFTGLDAATEAQVRSMWARIPWPATLPAWDRILIDDGGLIWLREFVTLDQSTTTWLAVDPRGRVVAEVEIAASLEPMHIGRDFIAGVARDDLERERILLLPLRRSARPD